MSKYLDTAKLAAKKAGKVLMKYYNQEAKIKNNRKKDNSFVSEADLAAEKIIIDTILKKFPDHSFHSEEKGKSKNNNEYCWYIDPLDGTHNFLRKIPFFGTSIALAKKDIFILGVIYLPLTNELIWAEKDKGSYSNNKKIFVSKRKFEDSLFLAPMPRINAENRVKLLSIFSNKIRDIRGFNCSVSSLTYIAKGIGDYTVSEFAVPHDCGAGLIIIQEAGGTVTNFDGASFTIKSENYIASNGRFHDELVKIMKEAWKQ